MVISNFDKQALKENSYTVLSRITIVGTDTVFTEDDAIVDWNYEDYRYVPGTGFIGQFVERILDGNLQNISEDVILEDKEINLQIGIVNGLNSQTTWYDYGNFLITKVSETDTTGNFKFESCDYTKKFNAVYEDNISYPTISLALANNVCEQANVELQPDGYCHFYVIPKEGLAAGNYNFNYNGTYYNFTLANDLNFYDTLMYVENTGILTLKTVDSSFNVTRTNLEVTVDSSATGTTLVFTRTPYVDFANNDFVIENNQYESEDTLRNVMQDIGKLAYSWVRVAEDNKVYIDFEQKSEESVDTFDELSTDEYYTSKKSDLYFGPVNKVLIGMKDVDGENLYKTSEDYTEETECAIKIFDNNLTYTEELRAIALDGCDRLFGLKYMPLEIETIGHPWLEGNELIKLTNVDEEELYTYPFNRQIKYAGYIEEVIGAEAPTSQETEYEYTKDIISDVKKTRFIVDKDNQRIDSLIERTEGSESRITELEQTTEGITASVEHLNDEYEQNVVIKKTAEGNPIEVEDAGNYALNNFKLYGATLQEPTPEEAGTTIQINGSATLTDVDTTKESRVLRLLGQTSQVQYTGNQLIDFSNPTSTTSTTTSFTNDVLSVVGSTGSYPNASWDILNIVKNNAGKTLKIKFDNISVTGGVGAIVQLIIVNNGATSYVGMVNRSGQVTTPYNIPSDTSNLTKFDFRIYTNSSSSATAETITMTKPLVYFNNNDTYEPYVGGTASPNPDYPQEVHVVSGDNEINICGKNLLDTSSSTTVKNQSGDDRQGYYCRIPTTGTYTIILNTTNTMYYGKSNNINSATTLIGSTSPTYQTTYNFNSGEYFVIWGTKTDSDKMMLSNSTTTYEPYIGNTYPIYLGVENLWSNQTSGWIPTSGAYPTTNATYPNARYVLIKLNAGESITLSNSTSENGRTRYIDTTTNQVVGAVSLLENEYYTTTTAGITQFSPGTITAKKEVIIAILDIQGNVNDLVVNYGKNVQYISNTPIELCKIGTYQDYIYKDNGSWYLHKEIGKVVLDGSENWRYQSAYDLTNTSQFAYLQAIEPLTNYLGYSNYFTRTTGWATLTTTDDNMFQLYQDKTIYIRINKTLASDLATFKTWLSTHNTIVYYVLATPTNTEITDTTLIEQLEALSS